MNEQKKNEDKSSLLVLVLFLGAAVLAVMSLGTGSAETSSSSMKPATPKSEQYKDSVNKHLMVTNDRMALAKERMALENERLARDFNRTAPQDIYERPTTGVDLSGESHAAQVANEIGRGERTRVISTPDDVIQKELFNAQQNEEYTQAYKKEYARQFVENARRGGYKVELNEDFKVISVTPIRRPSQSIQLFGESGGEPIR